MADGIAPAVDKVGPPAPGAPEADTQGPAASGFSGTAPVFTPTSEPTGPAIPGLSNIGTAPPPPAAPMEEKKLEHGAGGAGPALSAPKPVEVMSMPDTPINGSTPAGGTPRPELNIPMEKVEIPKGSGADVTSQPAPAAGTGIQEPTPTPAVSMPKEDSIPEPIKDSPVAAGLNGKPAGEPAEMTGAIQTNDTVASTEAPTLKRKLEDDQPDTSVNGNPVSQPEPDRAEKKTKIDETTAAPANSAKKPEELTSVSATEGNGTEETSEKTNGRAKKGMGKRAKKIAEAVVGKTARKTRSQGPA